MATPMQINARHGDESEAAHRSNRTIWIWAALVAVALLIAIGLLARAPTGPAANSGRVAAETANVKAGVAPGVASTYAGQPGGTTGGTPAPNPNAGGAPAAQ